MGVFGNRGYVAFLKRCGASVNGLSDIYGFSLVALRGEKIKHSGGKDLYIYTFLHIFAVAWVYLRAVEDG